MIPLIDGDVLAYRCGFASQTTFYHLSTEFGYLGEFEDKASAKLAVSEHELAEGSYELIPEIRAEPVANALHSCKAQIQQCLDVCNATKCRVYLTGKTNYRNEEAVTYSYKGNRKDVSKPVHHQAIRDYMLERWDAILVEGIEADDALSIAVSYTHLTLPTTPYV